MKKIFAILLLIPAFAFGQSTDSTQIKTKTDGGIKGDASQAVYVGVKYSGTSPASPLTGMLWCDTGTSPCTMKIYDGSAWVQTPTLTSVTTQADASSFPGSPTDGQIVFDKSHNWTWTYNGTTGLWCNPLGNCTSGNITDNFTGATISNPGSGMTIASSATAGNSTAGTHVCAVTFANASGGETTAGSSATTAVSITTVKSIDFASIPTGGSGTTQRRLYCSKASTTTPRYWIGTINDNSTTSSTQASLADGSMKITEPDVNYSAPLNARWTFTNATTQTTSGGCGATGSSVICRASHAGSSNGATGTTDPWLGIGASISAYNSGNYTIQYRIVRIGTGWAGNVTWPGGAGGVGGLSVGTAYASGPIEFQLHGFGSSSVGPPSSSNVWAPGFGLRTTLGGSIANTASQVTVFPKISAFPFYVRIVKFGTIHQAYISKDSLNWSIALSITTPAANPADSALGIVPSSVYDTFNWWMVDNGSSGADEVKEMDSFTLTVN